MRVLERDARRYAGRATAGATEQLGDMVTGLGDAFNRLRGNTGWVGDEAARYGNEAMRWGNSAARKLANEVEHRPLTMLAVVAGLGLLIGLAGRRS